MTTDQMTTTDQSIRKINRDPSAQRDFCVFLAESLERAYWIRHGGGNLATRDEIREHIADAIEEYCK